MADNIFLVQMNAVAGREDEFNDWYSNVHIGEVLAVPGWIAAQRFQLSGIQKPDAAPYPYRYLVVYEVDGDPGKAIDELMRAAPDMSSSTSLDPDRLAHMFEAISPRLT